MEEYMKAQRMEFDVNLDDDGTLYMRMEDYATSDYITKESAELIIEHLKKVFEL